MKKSNRISEKFMQSLADVRREHSERGQFLTAVERLAVQAQYQAVCGSWIAMDGGRTLLIRCIGEAFTLLLCDDSHCYKTIEREMTAAIQGRRLTITSEGPGGDISLGKDGLLRCGAYGTFRSEEDVLREEMFHEMEFALRDTEESDGAE
ncbi:MAG: hypothetical protein LUC96_01455 [Alistipes sp.]|uniref:hypothetical protein n=1 Tax=Alistipes sp. TaxID=1872444 RepID=UPI0025C36BFE|nr:hypothetical protein [Alistipes sp.]MCD8273647.1 hypothetical protein [Alistipes sp.]